jgi:hypothetical protein
LLIVENSHINGENDDDDDLESCAVFFSLANFSILATKKSEGANQCFLFGEISPNFDLKNMTQIRQISKEKNKSRKNRQIFMISSSR